MSRPINAIDERGVPIVTDHRQVTLMHWHYHVISLAKLVGDEIGMEPVVVLISKGNAHERALWLPPLCRQVTRELSISNNEMLGLVSQSGTAEQDQT